MVQIEIPTEFEPHMVEKIRSGALVLFSLLSFWLMSSANTSHHAQFHYEWYPSLTSKTWCRSEEVAEAATAVVYVRKSRT